MVGCVSDFSSIKQPYDFIGNSVDKITSYINKTQPKRLRFWFLSN